MPDLLFRTDDFVFSYRVAGICMQNGAVLLQKPTNDNGFAFPGGHAAFGETNEEMLIREFQEETGLDISVGALKWVGELFFPWGKKPCHQICLYYLVAVKDKAAADGGMFLGQEQLEGRNFEMEFHWIPLDRVKDIEVYPSNACQLLSCLENGVQHFVYRESENRNKK